MMPFPKSQCTKATAAVLASVVHGGIALMILLLLLLTLPSTLTGNRLFTGLLVVAFALAAVRTIRRWQTPSPGPWTVLRFGTAIFWLVIVDLGIFSHTFVPFWVVADTTAFCADAGALTPVCRGELSASLSALAPPPTGAYVYLADFGFHTALIVRTADLDEAVWPLARTLKQHRFVDIGWGDATYYPATEKSAAMGLSAFLVPGPSVLHLSPFDGDPARVFRGLDLLRIPLTTAGMSGLSRYLAEATALDQKGQPVLIGQGQDGPESHFYKANGLYYWPKTCNVWVGRALVAGGIPLTPDLAVTSRNLIHQASQVGFLAPPR